MDTPAKNIDQEFLKSISDILEQARQRAKTAVNPSMVYPYYAIEQRTGEEQLDNVINTGGYIYD